MRIRFVPDPKNKSQFKYLTINIAQFHSKTRTSEKHTAATLHHLTEIKSKQATQLDFLPLKLYLSSKNQDSKSPNFLVAQKI